MGASPRLDVILSIPGGTDVKLVATGADLEAAREQSNGRARELNDSSRPYEFTEQVLGKLIASSRENHGGRKTAFVLATYLQEAAVPAEQQLAVFNDLIDLLGIRPNSYERQIFTGQYSVQS